MLASVSPWRLRAVARLLLARRAVARRTERAGAASALRSEPSAKTSARGIALVCWSGWGIVSLSSRAIASGTRTGARSDRADRRRSGSRPLADCRRVAGCQSPARAAAVRDRESTRHAYALPNCVRSASWSSSLPVPLVGPRGKEQGVDPRAFNQVGTQPPGRWGNARRSTAPAPQSKPVTPASRLVAQEAPLVAFGLGLRILAAGPAIFDCTPFAGGYVSQSSIVCSAHPRARASADSSPARLVSHRACPRRNH